MKKNFWNSKKGRVLRWVGFLPISVTLSVISLFVIRIILIQFSLFKDNDSWQTFVGSLMLGTAIIIFIYSIYRIIPKYKMMGFWIVLALIAYLFLVNYDTGVRIKNRTLFSPEKARISTMEKLNRKSSFIDEMYFSVDYLVVKIGGNYYEYCNFDPERWEELKEIESLGKTYNSRIKGNYQCDEYFKDKYIDSWGEDEGYYEITGEKYPE